MDSITERPPSPNGTEGRRQVDQDGDEMKRAMLAGVLGAVVASVGYLVYTRLEDEHKEALRRSVTKFVEDKVGELRSQFKI
jgi:hypothetical protein